MLGRAKCKILKEIRQKIADENDIPYVTRECTYQGDCSGTCPKCESELRYLERELERRSRLGRSVAVTALCAGITVGTVGCSTSGIPFIGGNDLSGEVAPQESELSGAADSWEEETGDVADTDPTEEDEWVELEGEEVAEEDWTEDCSEDCTIEKGNDEGIEADPQEETKNEKKKTGSGDAGDPFGVEQVVNGTV